MIPRLSAAEVLRALRRDGWYIARQSGSSHMILRHPDRPGRVTLAYHTGKTIPPDTMARILKQAGLTGEELLELL